MECVEREIAAVVFRKGRAGDRVAVDVVEVTGRFVVGQVVVVHVIAGQPAAALRIQPAEFAAEHDATLAHVTRVERGIVVRREVQVDRLAPVEAIAAGNGDRGVQQAGAAALIDRKHQPRDVQHRHLADAQGRIVRNAHAFFGIDVDAPGAQLPHALRGFAGRIGGPDQRTVRAVHLDGLGAAVATATGQLVLHVLDPVRVLFLVAGGALGDHAHARILIAHAAFGGVIAGLAIERQPVGVQGLVAVAERDIALDQRARVLDVLELVALDVGGLLRARFRRPRGRLVEAGQGIDHRAQTPVLFPLPGLGGQRQRDAERQREQAKAGAHAGIQVLYKRPLACPIPCIRAMQTPVGGIDVHLQGSGGSGLSCAFGQGG